MADLVAEGGGSRQKGIHILKVSTRGNVASPKYSVAILKKELSADRVRQCQQVLWQEKGGGWTYASGISFSAAFD